MPPIADRLGATMFRPPVCRAVVVAACCVGIGGPGMALADEHTASGTVTRWSPISEVVIRANPDGTTSYCRYWNGTLTTDAGQQIDLFVETGLSGSLDTELLPTDPTAFKMVHTLERARSRKGSVATISYADSVLACGLTLTNVVTSASSTSPCIVPGLRGKSLPAARRALKAQSCAVGRITRRKSSSLRPGRVLSSAPKAGATRAEGSAVALVVSR
jgi:hypothetical protein